MSATFDVCKEARKEKRQYWNILILLLCSFVPQDQEPWNTWILGWIPLNPYLNLFIGPLSPTIHRGLEWPQVLNSLLVCLCLGLFSANFLIIGWTLLLFSCPSFDHIIDESIYHRNFWLVAWFHVEALIT